uniref:LIM domain 7a n=1 Tax=Cyclopterus lumpus TaxID=8103 RepID=A0A8C3AEC9_CYCLU
MLMTENKSGLSYRRSVTLTPKPTSQFNQFLPTKDKSTAYVPAPLRKKRAERNEDSRRSWANLTYAEDQATSSSGVNSRGVRPPQQGSVRVDHSLFREIYDDSEDEDDDVGYADPVQDDLYSRKLGVTPQPVAKVSYDKFLPKFWTPEEDTHIQKIKLGSQKRPWYKKMQGFRCIQLPLLVTPPLTFAPVDPASGPRLVKCERWPLLGRQDPREPPDPFDYESVVPDLENDDMFTRRTLAFQSNTDLFMMKTPLSAHRRPYSSEPQLNIVTQGHDADGDEIHYPDIEQDDVVYRKEKAQQAQQQRPLSGAPDNYAPMAIPEPWDLPPDLRARLLCPPCPLTHEAAADEHNGAGEEARPKTDDMLVRKLCSDASRSSQGDAWANQMTPSVPPSCSEGDLQRWQEIREASRLRYKKRLMVERLVMGFLFSVQDLSKWKNRRRSVNSDIVKKKEEREKTEESTSGSRRAKTFKEMQEERDTTTTSTPTSRSFFHRAQSPAPAAEAPLPVSVRTGTVETVETAAAVSLRKVPEPRRPLLRTQTEAGAPSSGSLYEQQPQPVSMEPKPPGVSRVSASLPRSYQKPDSARLTSIVAPRPFGTQSSRLTYVDDPQKRVNGDAVASKKSAVPSRFQQFMTSEDELQSQSSSAHSSEDEEEEEEEDKTSPQMVSSSQSISTQSVSSPQRISPVPPQVKTGAPVSPAPAKETSQVLALLAVDKTELSFSRISLNQKPNSSRDFGFQAAWDSTGACVASIQPGSPAEMCQLQAGDEVLTVNGHQVAEMSYPDWKSCMEEALQEGSLIMDIRHHGRNSESCECYVTLSETYDCDSAVSVIHISSTVPHGILLLFSISHVESEPISLTNLKRRSEFFEKGKKEEIPVPSIIPSSSRWSWDPEEERRRQEKWQKEQERLLQVHRGTLEYLEVSTGAGGPLSSLSPVGQPATPPWEEQERKRKEEHERQRQAEERRKREEEERELRRLQEERETRDRQQRQEEERKSRDEEELRWQRRKEEEREEERRRRQEAEEQQRRERERALAEQQQQQQRSVDLLLLLTVSSYGHHGDNNTVNKLLYCLHQHQVTGGVAAEKKGQQSASQAEQERQQILNEMKKKTPLLMDKSWIRQQSSTTSTTTEESDVPPMRRGESLDNLDASYNSWRSSWTPRSNSYGQSAARPNSALSGSTAFYGGGSAGVQRPPSSALPSSYSMGSLRAGAGTPSSPWSRQSPSPSPSSPSPTTSPEPTSEGGPPQQRSR